MYNIIIETKATFATMVESADTADLKSASSIRVRVQVPLVAPYADLAQRFECGGLINH